MNSLTPQQQQVLTMLATGNTIAVTAQAAGVHRNTIANWRRSSADFRETFTEMEREQCAYWRDQALPLAPEAIDTIRNVMNDYKSSHSVRLRAALAIYRQVSTPPPVEKQRSSREPDLRHFVRDLEHPRIRRPLTRESDLSTAPVAEPDIPNPQDAQSCTTGAPNAQDAQSCTTPPTPPREEKPATDAPFGDLDDESALDLLESMMTPPIRPPFPH